MPTPRAWSLAGLAVIAVYLTPPSSSAARPAASSPSAELFKDAKGKADAEVNVLVTNHYIHGVPYGLAQGLGPGAVPRLASILRDQGMKSYWRTTVQFLNFVGAPASFPILREFIVDRFEGEVDFDTYAAISAAIVTMGPLARISQPAFQFLNKGIDPSWWNVVKWTFSYSKSEKRNIQMSRNCLNALASSGMDEADHVLTELVRTSSQNRYWGELHDMVDAALKSNREIIKEGFDNNRKRRDADGGGKQRR